MKKVIALVLALSLTVGCGKAPTNSQLNMLRAIALASFPVLISQTSGFTPETIPALFNAVAQSGALPPQAAALLASPQNQQLLVDLFTVIKGGSGQQAALAGLAAFGDPAKISQIVGLILSVLQVAGPSLGFAISPEVMITISLVTTMLPVVIQLINMIPKPVAA